MLDGVRLKLQRAEDHLYLFDREVKAWHDRKSIEFIPEDHTESLSDARKHIGLPPRDVPDLPSIHRSYRVKFNTPLPPEWSIMLGDGIHNLRSSLDHLVWQLASKPLGTGASFVNEFPIYDTLTDFKKNSAQKLRGVSAPTRTLIQNIKPYSGGGRVGDNLVILNRLSRFDKHRVLNLVAIVPDSILVEPIKAGPVYGAFFHNVGIALKDGTVIADVMLAPDSEVNFSAHTFIHFEHGGPGDGMNTGVLLWSLKFIREDILPKFAHLFP